MTIRINRRCLLAAAAATIPAGLARAAEDPVTVLWDDLVPKNESEGTLFETLKDLDLMKQGENQSSWADQPPAAMVRDYDDKTVRIPGYVVPLGFQGVDVTEGLLVPYVGACIHVPPPPANQIIFIRLKEAQDEAGLWDPFWAVGRFTTAAVETELADVGYFMSDVTLEPYEF